MAIRFYDQALFYLQRLKVDYNGGGSAGWEGIHQGGQDWTTTTITLAPGETITQVSGLYGIDPTSGGTENIITQITVGFKKEVSKDASLLLKSPYGAAFML